LGKLTLRNESPAYLLYEILEKSFNYCFPMLEKIGQKLDLIEDDLYEDQSRKTLEEISVITQDVINFRRVIKPQRFFVNDLENTDLKFIDDKLDIYFDDIADKIERIWELLDNYKEVCDVLQRTNESILTQRLNEVMKTLTIITVIMLPLTVITGFYGMNIVGLPAAMHKYAAEIIIGIMMVVGFGMLYWFKKRNWL
jgi:magnesium transporter